MRIGSAEEARSLERLTFSRVRVLRELAEGRTEREIAQRLQMTYNGVRSHVQDLKDLTGCRDVRELGRWWRRNGPRWLEWVAGSGNCEVNTVRDWGTKGGNGSQFAVACCSCCAKYQDLRLYTSRPGAARGMGRDLVTSGTSSSRSVRAALGLSCDDANGR